MKYCSIEIEAIQLNMKNKDEIMDVLKSQGKIEIMGELKEEHGYYELSYREPNTNVSQSLKLSTVKDCGNYYIYDNDFTSIIVMKQAFFERFFKPIEQQKEE